MKSTTTVDQIRELLDREARGDFGPDGLGQDLQWFGDNWGTVRILRLGAFMAAPTLDKFFAKDHFVLNVSDNAPVKISYLGENFKACFLKGKGKIEEKSNGVPLRHFDLKKSMSDNAIVKKLGGEEKAAVTLADVYAQMAKQPNGESGDLLTNGYANIFYVYDQSNELWAVLVYWRGDGWRVCASLAPDPRGWFAGRRAFSPA